MFCFCFRYVAEVQASAESVSQLTPDTEQGDQNSPEGVETSAEGGNNPRDSGSSSSNHGEGDSNRVQESPVEDMKEKKESGTLNTSESERRSSHESEGEDSGSNSSSSASSLQSSQLADVRENLVAAHQEAQQLLRSLGEENQ